MPGWRNRFFGLLMKLREKVNHPEMEIILERLCRLLDREYEPVCVKSSKEDISKNIIYKEELSELYEDTYFDMKISSKRAPGLGSRSSQFRTRMYELLWGDVLGAIVRGN